MICCFCEFDISEMQKDSGMIGRFVFIPVWIPEAAANCRKLKETIYDLYTAKTGNFDYSLVLMDPKKVKSFDPKKDVGALIYPKRYRRQCVSPFMKRQQLICTVSQTTYQVQRMTNFT